VNRNHIGNKIYKHRKWTGKRKKRVGSKERNMGPADTYQSHTVDPEFHETQSSVPVFSGDSRGKKRRKVALFSQLGSIRRGGGSQYVQRTLNRRMP